MTEQVGAMSPDIITHIRMLLVNEEKRLAEWIGRGQTYCGVTFENIGDIKRTISECKRTLAQEMVSQCQSK